MPIANIISTLFNSHMTVHETYYQKGWMKGLIKAQYIQLRQWDNISHWDQLLRAAETLLTLGQDNNKQSIYENMVDCIGDAVGAIENPHDITMTISNDGSIIQLAVRYQYSWL